MKKKTALIFGISGQDGYLLSLFLKKKNYKIIGTYRNKKNLKNNKHINKIIKININNFKKVKLIIKKYLPNEIYNFSGVSDLKTSEENILENEKTNSLFVLNLLLFLKKNKKIKFFNSLSSEIFYNNNNKKKRIQNIKNFDPKNPYAIAKLSAFYYSKFFREKYNLYICNAVFFNHDSIYRSNRFIIPKIVKTLINAKFKIKDKLFLKNILNERDFGSAQYYIQLCWKMMQKNKPNDYIIGSGKSLSLLKIIKFISKKIALKINIIKSHNYYKVCFNKKIIIYGKYSIPKNLMIADTLKLKKDLNVKQIPPFEKTLISIINFYLKKRLIEKKIR